MNYALRMKLNKKEVAFQFCSNLIKVLFEEFYKERLYEIKI